MNNSARTNENSGMIAQTDDVFEAMNNGAEADRQANQCLD
jgi:hypothetical protein